MTKLKQTFPLYIMLAPYIIGLTIFVLIPAIFSLGVAFTHYNALSSPVWIGLENFRYLLTDRLFWLSIASTLFYVIIAVFLRIGGAFVLALLLQQWGKGSGLARTTIYLPTIIPDVAYAFIWLVALNPRYGPINMLLSTLQLPTPVWLADPWLARLALILMATWQLGEGFVILMVSLRDIPASLYEMAVIDGANKRIIFWRITLPLLLPRLLLLTARDLILSLQANFVPSLLVTKGGPGYATFFLPLYTYFLAFEDFRFGYAATVVWVMYFITIIIVVLQYKFTKHWQYEDSFEF